MFEIRKRLVSFDLVRKAIAKSDIKFVREKVVAQQKGKIEALKQYEQGSSGI